MIIHNPEGILALSKREIMRFLSVATQTIFPPLISSTLFICIFGLAIGRRIDFGDINITYLSFIIPGLMAMHLISSAYENVSASLFIARWHNHVQELLLSPLSYFEMVLGLLAGGVARGLIVTCGVYGIASLFNPMSIAHPLVLLYFIVVIAVFFSCVGMIAALWAEDFNMLTLWNTYFILPLVFLGGVFHPIRILPKAFQVFSKFNPLFYLVSGVRYGLAGWSEASVALSAAVGGGLALGFFFFTVYLFRIGYKLRT